jgi:hypothetical protein
VVNTLAAQEFQTTQHKPSASGTKCGSLGEPQMVEKSVWLT